jgi:hypothetical protein
MELRALKDLPLVENGTRISYAISSRTYEEES